MGSSVFLGLKAGGRGAVLCSIGELTEPGHLWVAASQETQMRVCTCSSVPVALARGRRGPEASRRSRGLGSSLALSLRHPQDSQTDTGIGRRQDTPRETHLHAWVTPAAACFLTPQEIRLGSLCGRTEPVSMATVAASSWLGREGRRLAEIAAGRSLVRASTLVRWGKAPMTPRRSGLRGHLVTGTRFSPVSLKGQYLLRWRLLGAPVIWKR